MRATLAKKAEFEREMARQQQVLQVQQAKLAEEMKALAEMR